MKLSNRIYKFLEGGPMPAEDPAAAGMGGAPEEAQEQGGMDAQLQQIAGQLLDSLMQQIGDPQAVAMILQTALDMLSQASAPSEQPAFQRRGGRLVRIR